MLAFRVYGIAQPKGSTRAFLPKGGRVPIITESNRNVRSWQQLVAQAASATLAVTAPEEVAGLRTGPVWLVVDYWLPRPKKYWSPRHAHVAHCTRPDLDKLVRAVQDALTGVVWTDDSGVIGVIAHKQYAALTAPPCVEITICREAEMDLETPAPPAPEPDPSPKPDDVPTPPTH